MQTIPSFSTGSSRPALLATIDARKCMKGTRTSVIDQIVMIWSERTLRSMCLKQQQRTSSGLWYTWFGEVSVGHLRCVCKCTMIRRLGATLLLQKGRSDAYPSPNTFSQPWSISSLACGYHTAKQLRKPYEMTPQLSPEATPQLLQKALLEPLSPLKKRPPRPLVVVIDALDECGDETTRKVLLE